MKPFTTLAVASALLAILVLPFNATAGASAARTEREAQASAVLGSFLTTTQGQGSLERRTIAFEGEDHPYLLYLPVLYNPGLPTPLLLVLHGGMNTPVERMLGFGFNELADESGFVLAYPIMDELRGTQERDGRLVRALITTLES